MVLEENMRHIIEKQNLHGEPKDYRVYLMEPLSPHDFWLSVTDVPCPVEGCGQTIVWYEAGYVPGYRVCMKPIDGNTYDALSIKHRFLAAGNAENPKLILEE